MDTTPEETLSFEDLHGMFTIEELKQWKFPKDIDDDKVTPEMAKSMNWPVEWVGLNRYVVYRIRIHHDIQVIESRMGPNAGKPIRYAESNPV